MRELAITRRRYEQGRLFGDAMLPEVCINIKMSTNGAADPMTDAFLKECDEFLKLVLETWCWTGTNCPIDVAVYAMVIEASRLVGREMPGA